MRKQKTNGNIITVVLVVGLFLAALVVASLTLFASGGVREAASKNLAANKLKVIGIALEQISVVNNDVTPSEVSQFVTCSLSPLKPENLVISSRPGSDADGGYACDLVYFPYYHRSLQKDDFVVAATEPGFFPSGGQVLYGDGRVVWHDSPEYERLLEKAQSDSNAANKRWKKMQTEEIKAAIMNLLTGGARKRHKR